MPLELSSRTSTGRLSSTSSTASSDYWNQIDLAASVLTRAEEVAAHQVSARLRKPSTLSGPIRTAIGDLKALQESKKRVFAKLRERLALQSQNCNAYARECTTPAEYKERRAYRDILTPLRAALGKLNHATAVSFPSEYVDAMRIKLHAIVDVNGLSPAPNSAHFRTLIMGLSDQARLPNTMSSSLQEWARKLYVYVCPLTGEWLVSRQSSYNSPYNGPKQELLDAGAVQAPDGTWYRSQAEKVAALKLREILSLCNGRLEVVELTEAEILAGTVRKTGDGRDVLLPARFRAVADYHSGIQDVSYDDSPRHVGIEIEVNAGSHNQEDRQRIAAEILLATSGRMKVERDGSITGFELITGHGKPSSVRQELAAVFRQKLLSGFRTARSTGAHVHVTASDNESNKTSRQTQYYRSLLPFYRDLAERTNTHHCRAGLHHGRYSEINASTDKGTVEFRLFRSQLKMAKLIRNAQFAWAFMELLGQYVPVDEGAAAGDAAVRGKFLEGLADLPREETVELRAWMAARGHKVPHVATDLRRLYRGLGVTAAMG